MPQTLFYCVNVSQGQLVSLLQERPDIRVDEVFTLLAINCADPQAIEGVKKELNRHGILVKAIDEQQGVGRVARRAD
uniref:hypothetical protein n=1 Tax=Trichocoleus desertorum TaxID=1481672 RepID=UPI0025B2DCE9|nr:hypothetical protein [Trichocoleus desertorum]